MHARALIFSFAPLLWLAACASQPASESSESSALSAPPADAGRATETPALATLRKGGTFAFALAESDPSPRLRAECAGESEGDATRANECYADIAAHAAGEGIRFEGASEGDVFWTSYGHDHGAEEVYLRARMRLAVEGPTSVIASQVGPLTGTMSAKATGKFPPLLRIDVPDARTVVMSDPRKGRLVYHLTR